MQQQQQQLDAARGGPSVPIGGDAKIAADGAQLSLGKEALELLQVTQHTAHLAGPVTLVAHAPAAGGGCATVGAGTLLLKLSLLHGGRLEGTAVLQSPVLGGQPPLLYRLLRLRRLTGAGAAAGAAGGDGDGQGPADAPAAPLESARFELEVAPPDGAPWSAVEQAAEQLPALVAEQQQQRQRLRRLGEQMSLLRAGKPCEFAARVREDAMGLLETEGPEAFIKQLWMLFGE